MKLSFQTAKSPVYTYMVEVEPEHPPSKDRRTTREKFRQEVQSE